MSLIFVTRIFLALRAFRSLPSALCAVDASAGLREGGAPETPPEGFLDAVTEAGYTLAAFFVAGIVIHGMQQRHSTKAKSRAARRKSQAIDVTVQGHSTSTAGARTATLAAARAAPATRSAAPSTSAVSKAGAREQPAQRKSQSSSAVSGKNRIISECNGIAAAVRANRAGDLPSLLDTALVRAAPTSKPEAVKQLLQSALRVCAARRCFTEALAVYDHAVAAHDAKCDSDMWSVLLYCAVESQEYRRCDYIFAKRLETGMPTGNDFVNMVRYYATTQDADGLKQTLEALRKRSFELDVISRNRALSACVSNKAMSLAEILVGDSTVAMDLVGFNTLMKCYAQNGDSVRSFATYEKMCASGFTPSDVTFGILLDACNEANDVKRAEEVFSNLRETGIRLNTIHYTSFMRVLASSGHFDRANEMLDEMLQSSVAAPDLVTYSTLIKAHSDHGNVTGALKVLERMIEQKVQPDAIIFNVVLSACTVNHQESVFIMHVNRKLVQFGMKTTTTSMSILVKAFSRNQDWDVALATLRHAPERLGVQPQARLFAQLAQAVRNIGGPGRKVVECYAALVRSAASAGIPVDAQVSARLHRLCSFSGVEAPATAIQDFINRSAGAVKADEFETLMEEILPSSPTTNEPPPGLTT